MKRVLVTGGNGFIGFPLCMHLHNKEFEVVAVSRTTQDPAKYPYASYSTGCISRFDGWALLLEGVDAVVHLAALTHAAGRLSPAESEYQAVNVTGTERLLKAAADAGVKRFVYMSSIKVNGERTQRGQPFTASDEPAPEDDYGRSKHAAERLVSQFCATSGMEAVILRPPLVVGPCVKGNLQRLMHVIRRGWWLPFGAIDNRRSMVSIDTLISAIEKVLVNSGVSDAPLLICDEPALSTPELVMNIADRMGQRPRLLPVPVPLLKIMGHIAGQGETVNRLCDSLEIDPGPAWQRLDCPPPDKNRVIKQALSGMIDEVVSDKAAFR